MYRNCLSFLCFRFSLNQQHHPSIDTFFVSFFLFLSALISDLLFTFERKSSLFSLILFCFENRIGNPSWAASVHHQHNLWREKSPLRFLLCLWMWNFFTFVTSSAGKRAGLQDIQSDRQTDTEAEILAILLATKRHRGREKSYDGKEGDIYVW